MSHTPYCPNELSPWPRLILGGTNQGKPSDLQASGDLDNIANDLSSHEHSPRLTRRPRNSRRRTLSILTSNSTQPCSDRNSFGSTQRYDDASDSIAVQPLNHQVSEREVERQLDLRRTRLKEAKRNGDDAERHRLKDMRLFDGIERPLIGDAMTEHAQFEGRFSEEIVHGGLAPLPNRDNSDSNLGHTPEICWHMKLQSLHGALIPDEFAECSIHAAPNRPSTPTKPTSSTITQSPSGFKNSTFFTTPSPSSRKTRASSIGSSTLQGSPTVVSPAKASITAPNADKEDPFLFIGKYIQHHSKNAKGPKKTEANENRVSQASAGKADQPGCICSNHHCHVDLSGGPSEHCHSCKLPGPQPEIRAAMRRIESTRKSRMSVRTYRASPSRPASAHENKYFEDLQKDMMLVDMYNAEMEERCSEGIWWQGWLVVEELKCRGIVGSVLLVHQRNGEAL